MKIEVIVVAAGTGTRLKAKIPKALVKVKGKPMVEWSLLTFQKCSLIDGIIVVGNKTYLKDFKKIAKPFSKVKAVIAGGAMRADSVRLGLNATDEMTKTILVHDAARPFVSEAAVIRLLQSLKIYKAAILAVPVKSTVKKVNPTTLIVEETIPRHLLWDVQTPQGFDKQVLAKAHAQKIKEEATDDAFLVEKLGVKVKVVMGEYKNIKVTTPEDLKIAKF